MKKVVVNETGEIGQLVEGYHELKPRAQLALIRLAYSNPQSWEVKLLVLKELFEANPLVIDLLERPENHEELWRLIQHLDWVWVGPKTLPISVLKLRGKKYYLPDEALTYVSVGEFIVATAHLIGFSTALNEADARRSLRLFLATICRPKPDVLQQLRRDKAAWNGDLREEYNTYRCEQRAENFGRVNEELGIGLVQWWNHAVTRLLKQHGLLGKADEETTSVLQGEFVRDWQKDVVLVAKSRVIGETIDKVYARSIDEFFGYVNVKRELETKYERETGSIAASE